MTILEVLLGLLLNKVPLLRKVLGHFKDRLLGKLCSSESQWELSHQRQLLPNQTVWLRYLWFSFAPPQATFHCSSNIQAMLPWLLLSGTPESKERQPNPLKNHSLLDMPADAALSQFFINCPYAPKGFNVPVSPMIIIGFCSESSFLIAGIVPCL